MLPVFWWGMLTLAAQGPSEGRDLFLQPFTVQSPWNTPIGSEAQYQPIKDLETHHGGITLKAALDADDALDPDRWKDAEIIVQHLQRVTNNGPDSVGGGGTPRALRAPRSSNKAVDTNLVRLVKTLSSKTVAAI